MAGLNHLINAWFQDELVKLKDDGLDIKRVSPITRIDISTLRFFSEAFKKKRNFLENMIDSYHRSSRLEAAIAAGNLKGELLQRTHKHIITLFKHFTSIQINKSLS